jgi:hypothetical protein
MINDNVLYIIAIVIFGLILLISYALYNYYSSNKKIKLICSFNLSPGGNNYLGLSKSDFIKNDVEVLVDNNIKLSDLILMFKLQYENESAFFRDSVKVKEDKLYFRQQGSFLDISWDKMSWGMYWMTYSLDKIKRQAEEKKLNQTLKELGFRNRMSVSFSCHSR